MHGGCVIVANVIVLLSVINNQRHPFSVNDVARITAVRCAEVFCDRWTVPIGPENVEMPALSGNYPFASEVTAGVVARGLPATSIRLSRPW
jgi:hypothetical protein